MPSRFFKYSMFYTVGIVLAFFLGLLLLGKKNKTLADYLLAFWLFWIGGHVWLYSLFAGGTIYDFPFLLGLGIPMPLGHPLLLYFYTNALCRGRLPRYWWVHLLPMAGSYLYMIPFFLLPAEQKIWVFQHRGAGYEGFLFLISLWINVSGVGYTVFAQWLLLRHRRVIANLFSNQERINLLWLQNLIYGLALIWIAVLTGMDVFVYSGAVLFVLFIGYFGIRQVGIFTNPSDLQLAQTEFAETDFLQKPDTGRPAPPDSDQASDKRKYEKSGLNPETAETLHQELRGLMERQQLYKEPELSLTDLAERLDTHPNYLSQIINEKEGKNFYDYINSMRVDSFLKMAANPEYRQFTLFALALECGFNSKSAFNRYFKKSMGLAPTTYLNRNDE